MSKTTDDSLYQIAKGTGIIFLGTIISMGLGFLGRVLLARFFTQSEYGIYSLVLVMLNITVIITSLGFQQGVPRQIAYYQGKKDTLKVQEVIASSLQIILIVSVLLSVILFFLSGIISKNIFNEPGLSAPLKIVSIAIPFFASIHIFTSIFRGFGQVKPKVYFQDILRSGLFPLFLIPVVLLGLSFSTAMCVFSASIIVTCIAFVIYATRKAPFSLIEERKLVINPVGKELLFFSLPLLGLFMLNMIMQWTDTLMLGFFKTAGDVGLYNAALPLSRLAGIIMGSVGFIYVPIVSEFYSRDLFQEMKRNYQVVTKWIFSATLPLFLVFFFFPTIVLDLFFGSQYVEANLALRILATVFLIHAFLGPNGITLLAMGKTGLLMYASLIGAILNIILNIVLIPLWGIVGAASATTLSLGTAHIFNSVGLYRVSKIHPFTKYHLKPMIFSIFLIVLIYGITNTLPNITFWMLPIFFVLFLIICVFSLLLSKSFEHEDITLILAIEKKLGINTTLIKRVLRRFM